MGNLNPKVKLRRFQSVKPNLEPTTFLILKLTIKPNTLKFTDPQQPNHRPPTQLRIDQIKDLNLNKHSVSLQTSIIMKGTRSLIFKS